MLLLKQRHEKKCAQDTMTKSEIKFYANRQKEKMLLKKGHLNTMLACHWTTEKASLCQRILTMTCFRDVFDRKLKRGIILRLHS